MVSKVNSSLQFLIFKFTSNVLFKIEEKMNYIIGVVGLGYVGLPLATAFSRNFQVIGFDKSSQRISELNSGFDKTNEVEPSSFKNSNLIFTAEAADLQHCNVYIITVPTPVDNNKNPDLSALIEASINIGNLISKGDIVIYESTVYPGCTRDICIPLLQKSSGLILTKDFFVGYSPERINPGDKLNTLEKITKVVSGCCSESKNLIANLYASIITAGVHTAESIEVAEAAKIIENTQRDINIALMNELKSIFDLLGINIFEVLDAANTKWNFLNFTPGLVGGHCIGVDPYYLAHCSLKVGHVPELILGGRSINENVPEIEARKFIQNLSKQIDKPLRSCNILILGVAFKENCSDIRNSKVIQLIYELQKYGVNIEVYDPVINQEVFKSQYPEISLITKISKIYDGSFLAVAHDKFRETGQLSELVLDSKIFYNYKNMEL